MADIGVVDVALADRQTLRLITVQHNRSPPQPASIAASFADPAVVGDFA
jgi:hypothetical protein